MLQKGMRVYHRSINGNGLIVKVDDTKQRDKYGVVFNWLRHKTVDFHDLDGAYPRQQCRWCSEDELVPSLMPSGFTNGRVSLVGNRSLERLIRRITRIKRTRDVYDETEIVINYGAGTSYTPDDALVLNDLIEYDKFNQCNMMRDAGVPVPEVHKGLSDSMDINTSGDWILKPHISMGGKNIKEYTGQGLMGRYFQKKVNKVREFRVHVAMWYKEPAYLIQEKMIFNKDQLCWNKKQGSSFHYVYEPHLNNTPLLDEIPSLTHNLLFTAINAVQALGLDFGGVDLAVDDEGQVWVFEVNTRCGLRERTFSIFKKVVWALESLDIEKYLEYREDLAQHEDEQEYEADECNGEETGTCDACPDEECANVSVNFELMNKRLSAMRADSEVQYA